MNAKVHHDPCISLCFSGQQEIANSIEDDAISSMLSSSSSCSSSLTAECCRKKSIDSRALPSHAVPTRKSSQCFAVHIARLQLANWITTSSPSEEANSLQTPNRCLLC